MKKTSVDHCFHVNGDIKTPIINNLYNTIKTYREALKFIEFSKPTLLEPLL